jgi:hypothetical protein
LIVDVVELEFELLNGLLRFFGDVYEYQVAAVKKDDLVLAGNHVVQHVLIVALNDRHERLHQAHERDQLHFIAITLININEFKQKNNENKWQ